MTTVGHSRCEVLSVIPARVVVEVRLDERVACPKDDTILSASTPPAIVERGKLADHLIVEATCDKYLEHTPVERQCARFARQGVDIAPQTLGRSVAAHIDLLTPMARLIEEQTRAPGLLGTDSTGIPILDPDVTDGIRTGAIWCWTNARWVTFFYSPSADSNSVRRFLGDDLARTVQCDGTNVTSFLERAGGKRPGCWSHYPELVVIQIRLPASVDDCRQSHKIIRATARPPDASIGCASHPDPDATRREGASGDRDVAIGWARLGHDRCVPRVGTPLAVALAGEGRRRRL